MMLRVGDCFWEEQSGFLCRSCVVVSPRSPVLLMANTALRRTHIGALGSTYGSDVLVFSPPAGKDDTGWMCVFQYPGTGP